MPGDRSWLLNSSTPKAGCIVWVARLNRRDLREPIERGAPSHSGTIPLSLRGTGSTPRVKPGASHQRSDASRPRHLSLLHQVRLELSHESFQDGGSLSVAGKQ